ncbi:23S rRNA (uracil(1939)-C(5))-methyltransferase RlmD [Sphaerochaeta globosa]|uniref:RNA methyltransferase, TrmA family n=1 Tax=Sphaerochaeta globosa (strain ATCC BAA-1886 / DSM 22777 / Buddy) TaxID=158189 RepID=F0RXD0_SPHGB|nr:23S rRNA (uracil(1939)-C(5))-methyltransferase RlmD [Sphaerochaeta globosa]ADY11980.1 RNA methyltransferase, TrmA family [Sphaerochaeta globosa str. Buddy]
MKRYAKCPLARTCGACQLMDYSYSKQLEMKMAYLEDLLGQFGPIAPIQGMDDPTSYRTKVQATFGYDWKDSLVSGIYQEGTHLLVPIRTCMVQHPLADSILKTIRNLATRFQITAYDEDEGYGYLRHVLIKISRKTNEAMVVLVCAQWPIPSSDNFIAALKQQHPEITTIALNMNREQTSMVLSEIPIKVLWGKGYIEEELCSLTFRISHSSFFQVNVEQAQVLYTLAMRMAQIDNDDVVVDAYCGTGTIALIAAKEGAKQVIGIESNEQAVEDAKLNAERNNLTNAEFICADASAHLKEMSKAKQSCDVLFLDPPRSGSDERFLAAAIRLAPKRIVYISCNPKTLERDLRYLLRFSDYEVSGIQPVDMFPHTEHLETVVLMTRRFDLDN